jgi:hypothetical protein
MILVLLYVQGGNQMLIAKFVGLGEEAIITSIYTRAVVARLLTNSHDV